MERKIMHSILHINNNKVKIMSSDTPSTQIVTSGYNVALKVICDNKDKASKASKCLFDQCDMQEHVEGEQVVGAGSDKYGTSWIVCHNMKLHL
jgi:hypothetical protein